MDIISILRDHGVHIGTVKKSNGGVGLGNAYVVTHTLPTTELSQKTWDVPVGAYDSETDTMLLFHNTGILDKASWTLTGEAATGYQVNIPDNPETAIEDNNVLIVVLRNAPTVPDGADISGTRLTNGSISLTKLGQDVLNAINNNGEKIEIVNDFTTGGADKVASAEIVKTLKNSVDANSEVVTNLEQTVSQNHQAVTETVENLQQTVTNNQQVVTEQLAQMKPKVENSWQKGIENDATIDNLSPYVASKVVYFSEWDADNSKLDALFINIPAATFSGMVKLSLVGNYGVGNSMGGAEVVYHIGKVNGSSYANSKQILSVSPSFANLFYIGEAIYQDNRFYIPITKAPNSRNHLAIKVELHSIASNNFSIVSSISVDRDALLSQPHPWTPQTASFVSTSGGTMTGDLTLNKSIPKIVLQPTLTTPDATKHFDMFYNAAGANNFGVAFSLDEKVVMQIIGRKDVRFFGHDDAWFSVQDLKSSVSNGKTLVASAISDMGVYTSPVETFPNMANNIRLISGKKAKGRVTVTSNRPGYVASYLRIANLGFAPTTVVAKKVGDNSNRRSSAVNADYFDASLGAIKMYASDSDVVYTGNSGWDGSVFWLQVDSPNGTEYEWRAYGE